MFKDRVLKMYFIKIIKYINKVFIVNLKINSEWKIEIKIQTINNLYYLM